MKRKCQVCGKEFDGEYIEFNQERNKDVYKCYMCNGFNFIEPVKEEEEMYDRLHSKEGL